MSKEIIYIDMDGVLANFGKAKRWHFENNPDLEERFKRSPDLIPGIFKDLEPIDQALDSVLYPNRYYFGIVHLMGFKKVSLS